MNCNLHIVIVIDWIWFDTVNTSQWQSRPCQSRHGDDLKTSGSWRSNLPLLLAPRRSSTLSSWEAITFLGNGTGVLSNCRLVQQYVCILHCKKKQTSKPVLVPGPRHRYSSGSWYARPLNHFTTFASRALLTMDLCLREHFRHRHFLKAWWLWVWLPSHSKSLTLSESVLTKSNPRSSGYGPRPRPWTNFR